MTRVQNVIRIKYRIISVRLVYKYNYFKPEKKC